MNKPNTLNNWVVVRDTDTGEKMISYSSFDELTKNYNGNLVEIPFENWLSEDMVGIFESELEDANYHSWTWLPENLNNEMINNKIPERERFNIMLKIYNDWYYCC